MVLFSYKKRVPFLTNCEADDFICLTEMMSGQTFTDCSAATDETTEKGG